MKASLPTWTLHWIRRNRNVVMLVKGIRMALARLFVHPGGRNSLAIVGFTCSIVGLLAVCLASVYEFGSLGKIVASVALWGSVLCIPGLILSSLASFKRPRKLAIWGVVLGIAGMLYVPTLFFGLFK